MGLRVIPQLLYGKGHAYAVPFTGTGNEASLEKLTRDDLAKWHATWFKPNNATLLIVGDTTLNRDHSQAGEDLCRMEARRCP